MAEHRVSETHKVKVYRTVVGDIQDFVTLTYLVLIHYQHHIEPSDI